MRVSVFFCLTFTLAVIVSPAATGFTKRKSCPR